MGIVEIFLGNFSGNFEQLVDRANIQNFSCILETYRISEDPFGGTHEEKVCLEDVPGLPTAVQGGRSQIL